MSDPELDELKREFLGEAEGKVREIETALQDKSNAQALERLAYLAHQLKGSGGSYGYQRISADAAEIEKAVEQFHDGDRAELETRIVPYVIGIRAEIEKRVQELSSAAS